MKKSHFIPTIFVLLLVAFRPPSSHILNGNVLDAITGVPVVGALIVHNEQNDSTFTDASGQFSLQLTAPQGWITISHQHFADQRIKITNERFVTIALQPQNKPTEFQLDEEKEVSQEAVPARISKKDHAIRYSSAATIGLAEQMPSQPYNTENYATIHESGFLASINNPLSTFSIDVDAASYSNVRRFINNGQRPPKDAVRIEEMINYFNYDYKQAIDDQPFSINTEMADCPWNPEHYLLHIGLQGRRIPTDDLPSSNLVFLIDVSGSMQPANKLPLLKSAFRMLVNELRPEDRVAIVVYAGAAGLVLPPTGGDQKAAIYSALDQLEAGGSTAGGAGLKLAYKVAEENFVQGGNNRIILASDGDFNIGPSSNAEMERLVEEKRSKGIFMTVLGFGMGNYKDDRMEIIADKGNGNYAYIDNISEARKVLVNEFGGTLFTIAKDVKIQVEFNPVKVQAYRLIGYENRILNKEDFNDDEKDAGELGSGHTVTALYEIIPTGLQSEYIKSIDALKYQELTVNKKHDELLTVKLRYKEPAGSNSKMMARALKDERIELKKTSDNFRWSAAVAEFGMLLRNSEFSAKADIDQVLALANGSKGQDINGYRKEFILLVHSSRYLSER